MLPNIEIVVHQQKSKYLRYLAESLANRALLERRKNEGRINRRAHEQTYVHYRRLPTWLTMAHILSYRISKKFINLHSPRGRPLGSQVFPSG